MKNRRKRTPRPQSPNAVRRLPRSPPVGSAGLPRRAIVDSNRDLVLPTLTLVADEFSRVVFGWHMDMPPP